MTATPLVDTTSATLRPAHGRRPATGLGVVQRWTAASRRRRYLVQQRHHDHADRSDSYLDAPGGAHLPRVMVAFLQR